MRRRRKKSIPIIIIICAGLALWALERIARQYVVAAGPVRTPPPAK